MTALLDIDGERRFAADLSDFLEGGLAAHGLELRPSGGGDRGVFAMRDLPTGYTLMCPQRFVLDGRAAGRTRLGAALQAAATQIARGGGGGDDGGGAVAAAAGVLGASGEFSGEDLLLAVLADARPSRSTGAPFAPYAALLPVEAPGALSWPANAGGRGLLAGTDLGAALEHADAEVKGLQLRLSAVALSSAFHYSCGGEEGRGRGGGGGGGGGGAGGFWSPPSEEDLCWAQGMLLSRRFPLVEREEHGSGGGSGGGGAFGYEGALIPLLDFLNHRVDAVAELSVIATAADATAAGSKLSVETIRGTLTGGSGGGGGGRDDDGGVVVLRNAAPVLANEQAWNNYGTDKSNEELLAMYGFAVSNNPADAVAFIVKGGGGQDSAEGHRFLIGRSGLTEELWEGLVAAVRGNGSGNGGGDGSGAMGDDDDDDDDEEEEERIEEAALGLLRSALESKLAAALSAGGDGSDEGTAGAARGAAAAAAAAAQGAAQASGGPVPDAAVTALQATQRVRNAGAYRKGVLEVLRGAVAECTAMAVC